MTILVAFGSIGVATLSAEGHLEKSCMVFLPRFQGNPCKTSYPTILAVPQVLGLWDFRLRTDMFSLCSEAI